MFRRRRTSRFPADMLERLDLLGRFGLDPQSSGIDPTVIWERCQAPFLDDLRHDRDGFLADLRALVAGDSSGFPALGASRLYFDLVDRSCRTEDALAIIDGGIAFKRARSLPSACLTDYELSRWREVNGPGTW